MSWTRKEPLSSQSSDRSANSGEEGEAQRAYEAGLRFLAPRARSVAEVRWRLGRRFSPPSVSAAIGRLEQAGLLDDVKFAAFWVEQRQTFSPRGQRALRAELAGKGVASAVIDAAVQPARDAEDELAYRAAARQARRRVSGRGVSAERWLMAYLERRGFGASSIRSAIARLGTEGADDSDPDDSALERG